MWSLRDPFAGAGLRSLFIVSYSFRFYVAVTIGFVAVVLEWRAEV